MEPYVYREWLITQAQFDAVAWNTWVAISFGCVIGIFLVSIAYALIGWMFCDNNARLSVNGALGLPLDRHPRLFGLVFEKYVRFTYRFYVRLWFGFIRVYNKLLGVWRNRKKFIPKVFGGKKRFLRRQ